MVQVRTCLWYHEKALEAAEFYCSLIPDSHIDKVQVAPPGTPGTAEGQPFLVDFTLGGIPVTAMAAGPAFTLDEAFSFVIVVKDQAELDHYWDALVADGGRESACGWCVDRFGLHWQVVPETIDALTIGADPAATRAREAMFTMGRLDIAALEAAYAGESVGA